MVIATAKEVKILGIANGPDGLQFVNSFMTTLTNGVHMHQIIGTSQGRIFMLGNDDNVWELDYRVSVVMKCYSQELLNSCNFSGKGNLVHQQMLQKSAHHWQLFPVSVWQTKRPYCTTGSQRGRHHFIPIDPKLIHSCCIFGNRRRYIQHSLQETRLHCRRKDIQPFFQPIYAQHTHCLYSHNHKARVSVLPLGRHHLQWIKNLLQQPKERPTYELRR